jgi:hypothetical protein
MASSDGKLSCEALSAWSNKPSGATKWVCRLIMRSMISAKATTEQSKRGQIGQPAACMMVNKANTPENFVCANYGLAAHPHELWITLLISFATPLSKPHECGDSTK